MERPNLLIVVLDCARAWDLPGGPDETPGMPFIDAFRREAWEFPRASSVAHWTVPSHASIFSGLYPWQHGVHAKGSLALPPDTDRLGPELRKAGYATISLSANGLVSPTLGFTSGCDQAAWGVSLFNRISEKTQPPQQGGGKTRASASAEGFLNRRLKPVSYWSAVYLARYPGVWDLGTRMIRRVRYSGAGAPPRMAPWLEPTLERGLRKVPAGQPVYCFINLLDAHEPYLSDPDEEATLAAWRAYAGTRQDRLGWVSGEWSPSDDEFARLKRLYKGMLRLLDRRVARIVQSFKDAGRWDDTLMILTSDHGQAFGEHGNLFHITSVDEPELRIPFYARFPGGNAGRRRAEGWVSLIDIAPTLLHAAGVGERAEGLPGVDLRDLVEAPRPTPVFALGDGLVHAPDAARSPPERRAKIDRLQIAAYLDDRKVVRDLVSGEVRAFNVARDRFEAHDLWTEEMADFAPLSDLADSVGRQTLGGGGAVLAADVEDRLRSWGYI